MPFWNRPSRATITATRSTFIMIILIVANVAAVVFETVQSIATAYGDFFWYFEVVSVAIFTIEYALRVSAYTANAVEGYGHPLWGRIRYVLTPLSIIDLLAFLPFYLSAFIGVDLRILRIFRLLRLFKLTPYSPALAILWAVHQNQARADRCGACDADHARIRLKRRIYRRA